MKYSLVMEELLDSASELQNFRKEVRREVSLFCAQPDGSMGLHPELFSSRLDELERKLEASLIAFLSVARTLKAVKGGKLLTVRLPAM
jgi:hypothetical protein